jgi:hypothetical protein
MRASREKDTLLPMIEFPNCLNKQRLLKTSDLKNRRLQEQQHCRSTREIARWALRAKHFIARTKYEYKSYLVGRAGFLGNNFC